MALGYKDLLAEAEKEVALIDLEAAAELIESDEVIFVDLRDIRELQREGKIPGATHAPRGMLEFWVDPESPYHKEVFAQSKRYIFYCASAWRSALAAQVVQRMGMTNVCHLEGGFTAWKQAGKPIEALAPRKPKGE